MSVLIVTSLGDLVIDLFTDKCPLTCKNFLKLCKIKYYNGCLFHTVQKDFTAQTGDPTGTGTGGDSVYKFLYGEQARFFSDEIHLDLKHSKTGTVAMANAGENLNASQFYVTLRDDLDYLDGKHTVFGEVAEGLETLTRINESFVDGKDRPLKNIRIKHTYILEDPFDDPSQLSELIPDASPEGKPKLEVDDEVRLEDDWVPLDEQLAPNELEEMFREKEAHSSAVVLEAVGDIPEAEVKPPDNVLFVCKLNPVTEDEDLHTIFSRFGPVLSAEIIRDYKTGDSLCYAFIEFEMKESCEQAYFKMDNALIDDRRIHVDFSQSVSKLWSQYRRKTNGTNKGGGCFKCGAVDHIAKDCTGGPAIKQPPKYILKDENAQHGGNNNSGYDMVFDDASVRSPRREKRNRGYETDYRIEKHKVNKMSSEDFKTRDQEKRHSSDRQRQSDRNSGQRGDKIYHDNKSTKYGGGRDRDYQEDRRDREFEMKESCEQAYFKMDNALIDDRRIHVDFSQSVSKLWSQYRRKTNGTNKGGGCFKCGAVDHIAKDCTGGPAIKQPPKYILKDENAQHGGNNNSGYDMVFDDASVRSPRREKRNRGYETDYRIEKHKVNKMSSEDFKTRDQEKRHSSDRQRQSDRNSGQRGDKIYHDNKSTKYGGGRDRDYQEDRRDREFEMKESCEQAYFKMDNALIDDRRIHVDFSQSVSKLWSQYRRKTNGTNKGGGCFKCGAVDHIAKDCTGGPAIKQPPKYILKDENAQHGGNNNSGYDMVFDDASVRSPRREKRNRGYETDYRIEKHKVNKMSSEDFKTRDQEKRHSSDRQRQSDRNSGQRGDKIYHDNKSTKYGGGRDRDYQEDRRDREHLDKWRDTDSRKRDEQYYERNDIDGCKERRDDRDYQKRAESGTHLDRRGGGSYRRIDDVDRSSQRDVRDYKEKYSDRHRLEERKHRSRVVDDDRIRDVERKHGGHRR